MTRKLILLGAVALLMFPSCQKLSTSAGDENLYVKTLGADTQTIGDDSSATVHGVLTNRVDIEANPDPDRGFEWSKDKSMSEDVRSLGWMDGEDEDMTKPTSEWRGFKANILPISPSTTYYFRAYVVLRGKKYYGVVKSFRTPDIPISEIVIDKSAAVISMSQGNTLQLNADVYPENARDRSVKWESNKENVATVDDCGLVTALSEGSVTITASSSQDPSKKATCIVRVISQMPEGAIDMGLPSGNLWHKMNLGASSEYDYGDFYAWGETTTKNSYTAENYKYFRKLDSNSAVPYSAYKYTGDKDTGTGVKDMLLELEDVDDVANMKIGTKWHIPTPWEWKELYENSTISAKSVDGVNCLVLTSKANGNQLVFPTAGAYFSDSGYDHEGSFGYFWLNRVKSSSPAINGVTLGKFYTLAYAAKLDYERATVFAAEYYWSYRANGLPIRAVYR